ncbi:MAG: glycoside hydrolase family 3 protein [Lachnospiraceae bacterium]|nr:glycoside hydrolase family 3 protein [Lachnospiraceae bacterium]
MNEKSAKKPGKVSAVLLCVFAAVLVALNAAIAVLVPQNFSVINSFFYHGPSGEEVEEARQNSATVTQEIEAEGIVLLENKNSALPLDAGIKINVFGYGSRDTVYGGTGSGSGDSSKNVTILQGLTNAGFTVNEELAAFYDAHFIPRVGVGYTGSNFDINETLLSEYPESMIENAKNFSNVAVFVISRYGGEGADLPMEMGASETEISSAGAAKSIGVKGGDAGKHYLELQNSEIEVLDMVKENFDTVIVLVNSTNAMELGFLEDEKVDAALWIGCIGSTGANAVGEVLSGKVNPSGKTSDTFAYEVESAPSYYSIGAYDYTNVEYVNTSPIASNHDPDVYHYVDYVEGIYVGYRFYETAAADGFIDYDATVQYPFGYGLSYTTFEKGIEDFANDRKNVTVKVKVTNTGDVAGKDVVEIYYSAPYTKGGIEKSEVVLADFAKTSLLAPGASETVELSFAVEDMASYDYLGIKAEGGAYVLEAGDYEIRLQSDSHTVIESRTISVAADVIYSDAKDGKRESDLIAAVNLFDDVTNGEKITYVSRADWEGTMPKERAAASREASEAIVAALTADEVANNSADPDIVTADHGLKLDDMKGLAYDDPKWDQLLEQVPVSEMVNLTANGGWATQDVPSVGKLLYTEVDGPNGVNNIMAGTTGNQFCAQSVLACSWNTDLAKKMGSTFAKEAIALDIAALYAPAMNIHRSPFSGRNYEYYSEDGLHSGKMAAAEILGMQGEGVTAYSKHFAVNDQETNRDAGGLCTWLNEQAMREIYLRGFELAVKEGGTRAIMSSFNRLGTTNAAESYPLLTTVLRNEWGFKGTVITDCVIQLGYVNVDRALRAGNDLQLSLMSLHVASDKTTGTTTGRQALRAATKNILYTAVNSVGQEVSGTPVFYPIYIGIAVLDLLLIALFVWALRRRMKKAAAYKEAQV